MAPHCDVIFCTEFGYNCEAAAWGLRRRRRRRRVCQRGEGFVIRWERFVEELSLLRRAAMGRRGISKPASKIKGYQVLVRQEGTRVHTHRAFCNHNHKNSCVAEMPSTSLFTRGLIAALLIISSMFFGNYVMFRDKALPAQGDTYVYATVDKPRDAIAPKARALQPSQSALAPSQKGPAGALETVRLSFSAHMHAEALQANTKVSVFLVKEVGVAPAARVMLFTLPDDDGSTGVVSTLSRAGENGKAAALRALAEGASVNPVPDLDFITPVGAVSDGHAVFVAYIRQERLHLKGRQQPANGKWVIFKEVVLSEGLQEAAVRFRLLTALRPTDTCLQGLARGYLNPWFKTAGLPPGSCG